MIDVKRVIIATLISIIVWISVLNGRFAESTAGRIAFLIVMTIVLITISITVLGWWFWLLDKFGGEIEQNDK